MGNISVICYSTIDIWRVILRDAPKTKLMVSVGGHKKYLITC